MTEQAQSPRLSTDRDRIEFLAEFIGLEVRHFSEGRLEFYRNGSQVRFNPLVSLEQEGAKQ